MMTIQRHRRILLAAALAMAAAGAVAADESVDDLLRNARKWEMKNDGERERIELIKLLHAAPDHAQGLLLRGLLEMHSGNLDLATEQLQRLKAAHPKDPAVAQLEEALRIAGKDAKKMAMVRLLVRAGKNEEAAAGMRSLFPKGAPLGNELALEYYRVIGNTPKGWDEARRGLERLVREQPDDWRDRVALAQTLSTHPETRRAGLQSFSQLAKNPDADHQQVLDAWRPGVLALERNSENIGYFRDYLAADAENAPVRDALASAQRAETERQPWILRDQADALVKQGRTDEAMAALKRALQIAPKNPWVRYDLARLYYKNGSPQQGRALVEEGVALAPNDADMLHAAALYFASADQPVDALRLLDKIPPAERSASIKSMWQKTAIQAQAQQAKALVQHGQRDQALALLDQAGKDAGNDEELVNEVANAWLDLGETDRALALMQRLVARGKPSVGLRLRYAGLLNRAERDDELAPLLAQIGAAKKLSDDEQADLRYLRTSLAARRADNLRHAGNYAGARAVLASALKQDPQNTDLLMALARVENSENHPDKAGAIYQDVLSRNPNDLGVRVALLWALSNANDQAGARREAQTILAQVPANDIKTRLSLADWYLNAKDVPAARRIVEPLRKAAPDDQRVLVMSGRIAKAEGDYGEAAGYFKEAKAEEEIGNMERNRAGYVVTGGLDYLKKSDGAPGISNLALTQAPVEVRMPVGYSGDRAFVQIDPVRVDAGTLSLTDLYNLRQFGKVLALSPNGLASAPAQSAQGTAIGAGYETGDIRADIGTTPLGFPVSDVVGGVKWAHYTSITGYSLEFARRPVTSTLLSYAGVRDPVTGQVYGGVRSTGVSGHASHDYGRLNAFLDLGYYALTGMNVMNNSEFALRTGLDWSFIREDDMRLTAGVALTNWRYKENLRFYTFGHGGYYSPQNYYSFAVPFRWTGREGRWSYLLKGSVSASVSYEKTMPFYPTDATLQAQANANGNIMSPYYTGGNGHGIGHSLGGALEYEATPHVFLGGRFDIDRSAYYTPNYAIVYFRYLFDAHQGPVPYPPEPVKPYPGY